MHKVINFFLEPFGKEWAFFIALWLLASSADVYFWSIHGNPAFGIYMGIHGFIQVYAIVLLLGLFRNRFRTILQWILLALGVLNLCADTCVHRIMHFGFTGDMVAIILGSNFSEASEFLPMYVTPQAILFIVSVIALAFLVLYFRKTISAWMKPWLQWGLAFVLLSFILLVSVRHSRNWEGVFLNKIGLFLSYDAPVDLTGYRTEPEIEVTGEQPETVVMIIGESLSKRHCSLYGYPRQTTPFWDAMAADSSLIVYNNVSSAYTNTVGAFQRLLTTYDNHAPEDTVWYKYTFLADVMSMAGYRTTWISNQSSSGIYDNIVAKFAALSDTVEWVGPKGLGIGKTNKDEDVFPFIQTLVASTPLDKNFVIIHLMGSHEGFGSRYPASFARFTEKDYPDKPEGQRSTLAEYDNSVLYSDYVVSTIMHLFDEKEALVLFFPDHSLDIYDSDPSYAGHARTGNEVSVRAGEDIPFILYPTSRYKEAFPDKMERIKSACSNAFNTEDLIYTIMDICNIKFAENVSVEEKSLLQLN